MANASFAKILGMTIEEEHVAVCETENAVAMIENYEKEHDEGNYLGPHEPHNASSTCAIDGMCDTSKQNMKLRSETWHQFLKLLKEPEYNSVYAPIRKFIKSAISGEEDIVNSQIRLHAFIDRCTGLFIQIHEKDSLLSEDSIRDGVEKVIMSKLYPTVFSTDSEEIERDSKFTQKLAQLDKWIQPFHLDLLVDLDDSRLEFAGMQLSDMDRFRAPMDKIICIVNCCNILTSLIHSLCSTELEEGPLSVDIFLPCLIFVIIRTCPRHCLLNLRYIWKFTHPKQLDGPKEYLFTHFYSAVSFIEDLNNESVGLSEEEFRIRMSPLYSAMEGDPAYSEDTVPSSKAVFNLSGHIENFSDQIACTNVPELPLDPIAWTNVPEFPHTFVFRSEESIYISEIGELLKEYKEMSLWISKLKSSSRPQSSDQKHDTVWKKLFNF